MDRVDESSAVAALTGAFGALGIEAVASPDHGVVAEVTPGERLNIAVDAYSVVRPGAARGLDGHRPVVVVADQIAAAQRAELDEAGVGWLDRRGHLKLRHGSVFIDADVPIIDRIRAARMPGALGGPVALSVALSALTCYPLPLPAVRELARRFGVSPSGVSAATIRLIEAGLVTRDRRAAVPALFWTASDAWSPSWVVLDGVPSASDEFVAVGTAAAAALGAPVVAKSPRLELLAASDAAVRSLIRRHTGPRVKRTRRSVAVALAPSPAVFDGVSEVTVAGFRCAAAPIVAVSIAGDHSRGAEIAETWKLDDRAW